MSLEYYNEYLDKILNFAITRYNYKPPENPSILPNSLTDIQTAISIFKDVLEYEAYQSLHQEEENKIENPMLYSVNLNTNEPGIVIGELNDSNKVVVHTKFKMKDKIVNSDKITKKPKNMDTLEKEATRAMKKILEKQQKQEYEIDMKKKNARIQNTEKKCKQKDKCGLRTNKLQEELTKYDIISNKTPVQYNKIEKKQTELDKIKDEVKLLNMEIENNQKTLPQDKLDVVDYNQKKQEAKLKKMEKPKEPKESKYPLKEKPKPKPKLENKHIIVCDEENDIVTDIITNFHTINKQEENIDYNTYTDTKNLDKNTVSFYPSPVPLERHINALHKCDPHPVLLPTLLYGKNVNDSFDMINIYHGPPGTGKTYRLILELDKLLNTTTSGKILLCAPSNIGVLNLYQKALDMNIYGRIIVGKNCHLEISEIDDKEKINKRVYFSTISMRDGKLLKDMEFTTIFMDEAAQCPEALAWGLLRKSVAKIYMAGDPLQLPALVSDTGKSLLYDRSLMERLMGLNVPVEFLNKQYRMNPDIVDFSNQKFYNHQIISNYNGESKNLEPLKIVHIDSKEQPEGTGFYNTIEAHKILDLCTSINKSFPNIVIISPYKSQCNLLIKMLKEQPNLKQIQVHTLDSFQGKEADVIILSTVRTGNNMGFWNDYRRLNVGLTRAKHILRVVGNVKAWKLHNGPIKDFYEFIKNKNKK